MAVGQIDVAKLTKVSEHDADLLQRMGFEVSRLYFGGSINTPVRWTIPSASESPEPKLDIAHLSPDDLESLTMAVQAFSDRQYDRAKELILPFTSRGMREANQLYVRILMDSKDSSWPDAAKKFNRLCTDSLYVPAGSTEVIDGVQWLLIHPALSRSNGYNSPRYVLRYVIFHEMLHGFLNTSHADPHPAIFRKMEAAIQDRGRAVEWLRRHHFSTIEDIAA